MPTTSPYCAVALALTQFKNYNKMQRTNKTRLSNKISTYTAKALAILKAIEYINSDINYNYITLHNDSLSTLTSLQNVHDSIDIAKKLQKAHYRAQLSSKNISYSWISGHCNTGRNERADLAAKQAYTSPNALVSAFFSYSDIKKTIEMDTLQQ